MARNILEKWISEYTLASKNATKGKLKEVFRGREELDRYIGEVGSVIVHAMAKNTGFDIIGKDKRILYAWTNEFEITTSYVNELKEDEKLFVGPKHNIFTVENKSDTPGLIVEVCSLPFSKNSYSRIGVRNTRHLPVLRESKEIKELLDGKLNQITVHDFDAYAFGGNHFHIDGKREMFLVVNGLAYIFERRVDKPSEGFGIRETIKRIQSGDKDYAVYHDSYGTGGMFNFQPIDKDRYILSHAIAAGKKSAKLIELASVAFDPENHQDSIMHDILVPLDYDTRKELLDRIDKDF